MVTTVPEQPPGTRLAPEDQDVTLIELLDRVIDKGVVLAGDLTLSVADIDLLYLGVRLMLCSVDRLPDWSPLKPR